MRSVNNLLNIQASAIRSPVSAEYHLSASMMRTDGWMAMSAVRFGKRR